MAYARLYRWVQPAQQHGLRIPLFSFERVFFIRILRVSAFLPEVTQQIPLVAPRRRIPPPPRPPPPAGGQAAGERLPQILRQGMYRTSRELFLGHFIKCNFFSRRQLFISASLFDAEDLSGCR